MKSPVCYYLHAVPTLAYIALASPANVSFYLMISSLVYRSLARPKTTAFVALIREYHALNHAGEQLNRSRLCMYVAPCAIHPLLLLVIVVF